MSGVNAASASVTAYVPGGMLENVYPPVEPLGASAEREKLAPLNAEPVSLAATPAELVAGDGTVTTPATLPALMASERPLTDAVALAVTVTLAVPAAT